MYKDYYKVLGVSPSATSEEIRTAYRKLAVKYHPDKNKSDTAKLRFNELNDANQILGDSEKRRKYDQFSADWKDHEANSGTARQKAGFDWSRYATNGSTTQRQGMSAEEVDAMFTSGSDIDLYELLFGSRKAGRTGKRSPVFTGEDLNAETTLTLEEVFSGTTRTIQLDGQIIKVTIPRGIADKQVLRIAGKGMDAVHGGSKGDLFLTVNIAPHAIFHRRGNDLHGDFPVDVYTAVLGGKALVKTLKCAVKVDIPKETPNHKVFRLQGLGMPVFGKNSTHGDLFVSVDIQMVEHLTPQESELFEKLASLRGKK
jgi:curved DNA-binding protein